MLIRAETDEDRDAVYAVNASTFETPAEANLADAFREQADLLILLVAEDNGQIVGHIISRQHPSFPKIRCDIVQKLLTFFFLAAARDVRYNAGISAPVLSNQRVRARD